MRHLRRLRRLRRFRRLRRLRCLRCLRCLRRLRRLKRENQLKVEAAEPMAKFMNKYGEFIASEALPTLRNNTEIEISNDENNTLN